MLDIQLLRADLDRVATRLADRGYVFDRARFLALMPYTDLHQG